jgi:hypothetical protein
MTSANGTPARPASVMKPARRLGWGRDHPAVKAAIDALMAAPDEELKDLAAVLPEFMTDHALAREGLIRMGRSADVRRDLLCIGLEACGCGATDHDAVTAVLAHPEQLRGFFDAFHPLFRVFGAHPLVRTLALKVLREEESPMAAIAIG